MSAPRSVAVVTGPMACGKSFHADTIKRRLACDWIVDGWEPGDTRVIPDNALVLTTAPRAAIAEAFRNVAIYDFDYFGLPKPGEPA